jgi:aminodeoxyfutalosine synthase
VLDNFGHIKSYWPMSGLETAAAALSWGADDMDGTISEERIAHLAGATTPKGTGPGDE